LSKIDPQKLPREVLEKAVMLKDPLKTIFIALYCKGLTTPIEIAEEVGHARAYVHMRLVQLEAMGLASRKYDGKKVKFEVVL
jgi:DNA-binding MarR family transcriptional regulator